MQQLTVMIDFVSSPNLQLKRAAIGYLLSTETNVSVLTYQTVYATKFHSGVLWFQCKDDVKWVGNFYRSLLFDFFLEKFCLE